MTICIFPGTFNPIHNGHIKMAEYALFEYNFDKIIFIPAYIPPHKYLDSNLAEHRFNMVKLALSNNSKFEVSDIEYKSESKSYSLITVKKIIEQYEMNDRLNFIIGTDAFSKIETWYKAEELKNLVHFIVFPRKGDDIDEIKELKNKEWDFEFTNMDYVDLSSTNIREQGVFKKSINKEVEDYIKLNGLYKS